MGVRRCGRGELYGESETLLALGWLDCGRAAVRRCKFDFDRALDGSSRLKRQAEDQILHRVSW